MQQGCPERQSSRLIHHPDKIITRTGHYYQVVSTKLRGRQTFATALAFATPTMGAFPFPPSSESDESSDEESAVFLEMAIGATLMAALTAAFAGGGLLAVASSSEESLELSVAGGGRFCPACEVPASGLLFLLGGALKIRLMTISTQTNASRSRRV